MAEPPRRLWIWQVSRGNLHRSLRMIPKIPFHEFPWVLSLYIITSAGAYTHNISIMFRIVGADLNKHDRWKRDFQKEGHLSRLLLVINKFPLFWRKTFPKYVIIAAEKNIIRRQQQSQHFSISHSPICHLIFQFPFPILHFPFPVLVTSLCTPSMMSSQLLPSQLPCCFFCWWGYNWLPENVLYK